MPVRVVPAGELAVFRGEYKDKREFDGCGNAENVVEDTFLSCYSEPVCIFYRAFWLKFFFCLKLGSSEIIPTLEFFKQVAANICEIETLQTPKSTKRYVLKAKEY